MSEAENQFNQAKQLIQSGNLSEALPLLLDMVRLHPNHPTIHAQLGIVYQKIKEYSKAESHYLQAQKLQPDFPEIFNNLSILYKETGRFDEGLVYIEKALQYNSQEPNYLNSQGTLLLKMNEFDQAQDCFERAIEYDSQYVTGYLNLSNTFLARHDLNRAMEYIQKALALNPRGVEENWNLALLYLFSGDFDKGFKLYEWRWEKEEFKKNDRTYSQPRWDGRPHPDKTIFIWPEQGFGDTLQFIRYVPLLKNKFRRIVVEVQSPLQTLVSALPGIDVISSSDNSFSDFDYHLPLLSLAQYFTLDEFTIPATVPYLFPNEGGLQLNPEPDRPLKIGLVWAGRPTHENDHNRSLSFSVLESLIGRKEVTWYSLQKGQASKAIRNHPNIIDLAGYINDFLDTARLIKQMDLVITIDSSVCHLAGALGIETWLLLPYQSDWRWMYGRSESPWYPTMELFRQDASCKWDIVVEEVNARITKKIKEST